MSNPPKITPSKSILLGPKVKPQEMKRQNPTPEGIRIAQEILNDVFEPLWDKSLEAECAIQLSEYIQTLVGDLVAFKATHESQVFPLEGQTQGVIAENPNCFIVASKDGKTITKKLRDEQPLRFAYKDYFRFSAIAFLIGKGYQGVALPISMRFFLPLYDDCTLDSLVYVEEVQERSTCDLKEFHARGKKDGTLDIKRVLVIMLELLKILSHLHEKRVLHLDVKPENVFISTDAAGKTTVKLGDFGLSRVGKSSKYFSGITALYRPPEGSTKIFTHYSDVWSFACVFFEMVTEVYLFTPPQHWVRDEDFFQKLMIQMSSMLVWEKNDDCGANPNPNPQAKLDRSKFERFGEIAGPEATRVLLGMLRIDPKRRPTATELLKDPFFESVSNENWKKAKVPEAKVSLPEARVIQNLPGKKPLTKAKHSVVAQQTGRRPRTRSQRSLSPPKNRNKH